MFLELIPHIGTPRTHDDWTVTWEAIGAIGSILAAVGTLWAVWVSVNLARREREERLDAEAARDKMEKERAVLGVAFQIQEFGNQHAGEWRFAPLLSNYSQTAITDIDYFAGPLGAEVKRFHLLILKPREPQPHIREIRFDCPLDERSAFVEFTDATRKRWRLHSTGKLEICLVRPKDDLQPHEDE